MQATCKFLFAIGLFTVFALPARAADASSPSPDAAAVKIGDKVAEFTFKDIRYLPRKLADFGDKKAYVLMFATLTDLARSGRAFSSLPTRSATAGASPGSPMIMRRARPCLSRSWQNIESLPM